MESNGYGELGHIGVLMGGDSSEREISLKSGNAVYEALKGRGCSVTPLKLDSCGKDEICALINDKKIDVVFIALHGGAGEDGRVQKMLEDKGIIYAGSDSRSSKLAMDKSSTQTLLRENDINVPDFCVLSSTDAGVKSSMPEGFKKFPIVVKPACEGSSIGVSIVYEEWHLEDALSTAFKYGKSVVVEDYIAGKEMTAGLLDNQKLPLVEIRSSNRFFDYDSKYKKGMTEYIVPAQVSELVAQTIQETALKTFSVLGCRDFARVDFILDKDERPFVLEVNTIPGFTETSLLPKAAKAAGYEFPDLCLKIIGLAVKRGGLARK